jgi:hypothetical protein
MLPDPVVPMDVVARPVLDVVVLIDRRSQSVPVSTESTLPDAFVSDAAVVNGSIVSYTTAAFAALTQATDRTIEEMKVVLRI